jgi:hypothetical protein
MCTGVMCGVMCVCSVPPLHLMKPASFLAWRVCVCVCVCVCACVCVCVLCAQACVSVVCMCCVHYCVCIVCVHSAPSLLKQEPHLGQSPVTPTWFCGSGALASGGDLRLTQCQDAPETSGGAISPFWCFPCGSTFAVLVTSRPISHLCEQRQGGGAQDSVCAFQSLFGLCLGPALLCPLDM